MANENIVAAYARVSTKSENQASSFKNQKNYFENAVEQTEGLTFYKLYADEGLSGVYWKKRDDFNNMLKDAGIDVVEEFDYRTKKNETRYYVSKREAKFGQIWIKNTSRYARNTFSFEIIEKLRQKGVYIRFLTQNIYTKDPSQDFTLKLIMSMDENESRVKSEAVKWGYLRGKEKGNVYTHPSITGYDYDKKKMTLKKNKDAKSIKRIYDMYTEEGLGIRRIVMKLNEEGIKPPSGADFWGYTTIKNILKNEKYYGGNNALKYDHGEFGHKTWAHEKEEYDVIQTDKIEPIITKEQFDKAQDIKAGRNIVFNGKKKGTKTEYHRYSKKLICHNCGGYYSRNNDYRHKDKDGKRTDKYWFYNCTNKRKKGSAFCSNPNVIEETLDNDIKNFSYGTINNEIRKRQRNYMYLLLKVCVLELDEIDEDSERVSSILKEQINEKKNMAKTYFKRLIENPELDKHGVFENMIEELNNEIEELQNQLDFTISSNQQIYDNINIMLDEYEKIKNMEFVLKPRYSEAEVIDMIDKIYVWRYQRKLTKEELETGYVNLNSLDNNRKSTLMYTFTIYREAREILQKYEKKYKFNTENMEKMKCEITDEELNTYYNQILEKVERA